MPGRPSPRVVCVLPVCVTDDEAAAQARAAKVFAIYDTLPSYKAMLDKEGAAGPGDVAIVGDEAAVRQQIEALAGIGVTDFVAGEFATGEDAARTRALLRDLATGGSVVSVRTAGRAAGVRPSVRRAPAPGRRGRRSRSPDRPARSPPRAPPARRCAS